MSDGVQTAEFIYLIAVLVLVVSALMVRKVPIGRGLKMFAGWVIIFAAAFVAFALKDDVIALGKRVAEAGSGAPQIVREGETLRVRQAYDGHFWVDAEVNGEKVRFLIDSGATTTSISTDTARGSRRAAGFRRWCGPQTAWSRSAAGAPSGSRSGLSCAGISASISPKRSAI